MEPESSDGTKRNPQPQGIPRSPEEFAAALGGKNEARRAEVLKTIESRNEKIRKAQAIKVMLQSEQWTWFWESIKEYTDIIPMDFIPSLKGSTLDKGAAVERMQGRLEIMQMIATETDAWLHWSKQPPVEEPKEEAETPE